MNLTARTGAPKAWGVVTCSAGNENEFANNSRHAKRLRHLAMSKDWENKTVATRWLKGFWSTPWNPGIVDELAARGILLQFSLQMPRRGREEVKNFMVGLREAFHDLEFHCADLVVDGEYVGGDLQGAGMHVGPAFLDVLVGFLPACWGRKMCLTGTTV